MRTGWRWIAAAALTAYVGLLVLAGWQPEIRPAWLDSASDASLRWLRTFGIRPGVAVFDDHRSDPGWQKRRFLCIQVWGMRANGRRDAIHAGDCSPRMKVWFPGEDVMLYFLVVRASGREAERERAGGAPGLDSEPLAALREHFLRRGEALGGGYDRYVLAVTDHRVDYRTGEQSEGPILHMAWRNQGKKVFIAWSGGGGDANGSAGE